MEPGVVQRKLYKLSKGRVRIYCGDDKTKPAGVYYVQNGEYIEICSIDKNMVPEHVERRLDGSIRKGGWRRVLRILIQRKLIDRREAERSFGTRLSYAAFNRFKLQQDPIAKLVARAKQRSVEKLMNKTGIYNPNYMDVQELLDLRDAKRRLKQEGEIL